MKIAALIIGIFGSAAGFIAALFGLLIGGIDAAIGGGTQIAWMAFVALGVSVLALVGAALAIAKPRFSAVVMVVCGVVGLVFVGLFWIVAAILLAIAALLAFLGRKG